MVAIDGKAIRSSFANAGDRSGMAHLVSAMVCQGGNRMVFGQVAVDGKSHEITGIPKLLELLPLKDNRKTLHAKVKALMALDGVAGWSQDYLLNILVR